MKRRGYIMQEATDLNNLYSAFQKAAKQKESKPEVIEYKKELHNNLRKLQKELENGFPEIGNYTYFTIFDPKKRIICAASFPERIIHHALMNVVHENFEDNQLFDSYATRLNKGTYKALDRAAYYSKKYKYYLKSDIRKYFDSINHRILKNQLNEMFKDNRFLELVYAIIDSYQIENKGLPIGNLTSQYFANNYLTPFDQFIKHELKAPAYVRYMDDFVVWSDSITELQNIKAEAEVYLKNQLYLDLKYSYINATQHGLNFLSYRIFNSHIELQQKSKQRFIYKLNNYDELLNLNLISESDYARRTDALVSFTEHASAKGFRKFVMENIE